MKGEKLSIEDISSMVDCMEESVRELENVAVSEGIGNMSMVDVISTSDDGN